MKTMTPETFKAHRLAMGLSQSGMAKLLGLSMRQIVRYEANHSIIPNPVAILIEFLDLN